MDFVLLNRRVAITLLVFLGLVCAATLVVITPALANGVGLLWLDPPDVDIDPGGSADVVIQLNDVTNVYGAQVSLSFDPAVLEVVDADLGTGGVQISTGTCPTPDFVITNSADNVTGTIDFAAISFNPTPACDGGDVATIEFQCVTTGAVSDVMFTDSIISDPGGGEVAHNTQDGTVTCLRHSIIPADFDGDGDTDISVYHWHPLYGQQWYIKDQGTFSWGAETSIPVPADYDGDGDTDIAVYDNGLWYIKDFGVFGWGGPNSVPVPGDYDGDGDADIAVIDFHPIFGLLWYIKDQPTHSWGNAASLPVQADYDGDGMTDVAVYNDGTWYIEGIGVFGWGNAASIPVPGDYDGDGDADLAVYLVESGTGVWYIQGQPTAWWGGADSIPVPGDYNGDGVTDIAVYHLGTWYVKDVLTDTWGGPGDYPLPAPDYDGDGQPH